MKEIFSDKENVALFWTGGWDSTFQLLQLLIIQRRRVIPFYLIDTGRRSTGMELRTIKYIKDHLLKKYPYIHELLQPTQYFAVADISADSEITGAFQSVFKKAFIGSQYDFLARFCKENGITNIQLCIHRDDKAHFIIENIVSESVDGLQTVLRTDTDVQEIDEYVLFRYFSFPIFNLSKIQMSAIANKQGWEEIMGMTWFCHNPTNNMRPCGICNPCLYVIEEGFGWRIPVRRRIVSFFYRPLNRTLKPLVKIILAKLGLLKHIQ